MRIAESLVVVPEIVPPEMSIGSAAKVAEGSIAQKKRRDIVDFARRRVLLVIVVLISTYRLVKNLNSKLIDL